MISVGALVAAGIHPTQARQFADPLSAACALYDISTPARIAGFVAQCRVESSNFTALEEDLNYRTAEAIMQTFPNEVRSMADAARLVRKPQDLANTVYANRLGNGDFASGDGWNFRGSGPIGVTGRAAFADAQAEIGRPYLTQPGLVRLASDGCLLAAWIWSTKKCNLLADSSQWNAITRAINGPAMLQADLRAQYSDEGVRAFA